jgi:hypothetical protein
MRTFILLTFVAMITGCQHAQTCAVRSGGNCREQTTTRRPCDLSNACRRVQSACQKACQSPSNLGCKTPGIGWKEVRVPVLKLKDRRSNCVADQRYNDRRSCDSGSPCSQNPQCAPHVSCKSPTAGCCQNFPTRASEATPFLTHPPPQSEAAVPAPQTWQLHSELPQQTPPIASSTTTNLAQRTQNMEAPVNQIHSMLQHRQAANLPTSGYIDRQPAQQKELIMLPPPNWRTMDGVPPIPNSAIEQTGAYRSQSGTYRTTGNPQMWPHSPQNMQRSMYQ